MESGNNVARKANLKGKTHTASCFTSKAESKQVEQICILISFCLAGFKYRP